MTGKTIANYEFIFNDAPIDIPVFFKSPQGPTNYFCCDSQNSRESEWKSPAWDVL